MTALLVLSSGCGYVLRGEPIAEPVELIAVVPLARQEAPPPASSDEADEVPPQRLAPGAEHAVTAQVYGVLANSPRWRFVPDLTVQDAMRRAGKSGSFQEHAVQVGKAVKADAVLTGSVSRFVQRDGSDYGARNPASVSLQLRLISTRSGEVLWQDDFDKTQEALSSNLLNWWMFWRAGPRWLSAEELARLGIEQLLDDLDRRMPK